MFTFKTRQIQLLNMRGGGPRVVVSTAALHARVRGSIPGLGGLKETKLFLPHPRVKVSIVGSLRDREVACSASDRQGSNFESCVWRTVSSQSSHHPQEVLLAQFSLYVHKGGLKPDSFHLLNMHCYNLIISKAHNFQPAIYFIKRAELLLWQDQLDFQPVIKSPPTMWWWGLIVFAESARRSHLFLLSLKNPYSDYFQIFTVCILALGNLSGKFFLCVFQFLQQNPRWPPKSYGAR